MAGFDFSAGRSNNMVAAEERGAVTIGRWGERYRVSAAAVQEVMRPHEAHHTGTGRRGKSRLTYVIDSATEPSAEQLAAMREFDRAARPVRRAKWLAAKRAREAAVRRVAEKEALEAARRNVEAARRKILQPIESRIMRAVLAAMPREPVVRMHRLDGEDRRAMEDRRSAEVLIHQSWKIALHALAATMRGADEEWRQAMAEIQREIQ